MAISTPTAIIYLGWLLPDTSSGTTIQRNGEKTNPSFSDLAPNRGLPSQRLTTLLVRSYHTFAPLPEGGIFLWHYPHDRSHWALPSKFGLSGARTFLRLIESVITYAYSLPSFPILLQNQLSVISYQSSVISVKTCPSAAML